MLQLRSHTTAARALITGLVGSLQLHWRVLAICLCMGAVLVPAPRAAASTSHLRNVLVLHAYHQGLTWTDAIMAGMEEAFEASGLDLDVHVEYMDTKRYPPPASFGILEAYYRDKYANTAFEVILVSDNNALSFILSVRDRLFPEVPVVFCGINNFTPDMLEGAAGITGITEEIDIPGTINLARQVLPGIRRFVVVNDTTPTGLANQAKFDRARQDLAHTPILFEQIRDVTGLELQERLAKLPGDAAVLLFTFHRDRQGNWYPTPEFLDLVRFSCPRPVFSFWDHHAGRGVMGGKMVYGREQGWRCAQYAARILAGTRVADLPVLKSPNVAVLDYPLMQAFQVDAARVPDQALVLSRPDSLLDRYRHILLPSAIVLVLLLVMVVALSVNILMRKRAVARLKASEKAARESHERFLSVLNSLDATIYISDLDTHEILFMNQHMIDSFGRDFTGRVCWEVFRGEKGPCAHCTNKKLLDGGGRPAGVQIWQDRNPITGKWYINHDRAIEWLDGKPVRLQIATDITELKRMEEELRQAHKMESIGTLAGGIAHDFNNILGIILGNTELVLDEVAPDSSAGLNLKEIRRASLRARELVLQLLSFSRKTDHEKEVADIGPVIRDTLGLVRATTPAFIEVTSRLPDTPMPVLANTTQIRQVIINLCTNAVQAMEEAGGVLTVSLGRLDADAAVDMADIEPDAAQYACLRVTDTGAGISPRILDRIFDPYFTTRDRGKGPGMGLAMVHGIVMDHTGAVRVDSRPGRGTEIRVLLPIAVNHPD